MPATITTNEEFDRSLPKSHLEREVELRILAGAIRSTIRDLGEKWVLETEWNVFGQQ